VSETPADIWRTVAAEAREAVAYWNARVTQLNAEWLEGLERLRAAELRAQRFDAMAEDWEAEHAGGLVQD